MRVFLSYSHRDEGALERLMVHLAVLRRTELIEAWHDCIILAGGDFDKEIQRELDAADLILLLVSSDFLASDYCTTIEMERALERHKAGKARVVPIIVNDCDWHPVKQLSRLKALPKDGRAVTEWPNPESAWKDVVKEIRRIVEVANSSAAANPIEPIDEQSTETAGKSGVVVKEVVPLKANNLIAAEPKFSTSSKPTAATDPKDWAAAAAAQYRVRRDFSDIDRIDFRNSAYEVIKDHCRAASDDISGEAIEARFYETGPTSFGCTVINRGLAHGGVAHITVHRGGDRWLGDIFYNRDENGSSDNASGGFNVLHDDYQQYLEETFVVPPSDKRYTPKEAAEHLWRNFLARAGIEYD